MPPYHHTSHYSALMPALPTWTTRYELHRRLFRSWWCCRCCHFRCHDWTTSFPCDTWARWHRCSFPIRASPVAPPERKFLQNYERGKKEQEMILLHEFQHGQRIIDWKRLKAFEIKKKTESLFTCTGLRWETFNFHIIRLYFNSINLRRTITKFNPPARSEESSLNSQLAHLSLSFVETDRPSSSHFIIAINGFSSILVHFFREVGFISLRPDKRRKAKLLNQ